MVRLRDGTPERFSTMGSTGNRRAGSAGRRLPSHETDSGRPSLIISGQLTASAPAAATADGPYGGPGLDRGRKSGLRGTESALPTIRGHRRIRSKSYAKDLRIGSSVAEQTSDGSGSDLELHGALGRIPPGMPAKAPAARRRQVGPRSGRGCRLCPVRFGFQEICR